MGTKHFWQDKSNNSGGLETVTNLFPSALLYLKKINREPIATKPYTDLFEPISGAPFLYPTDELHFCSLKYNFSILVTV